MSVADPPAYVEIIVDNFLRFRGLLIRHFYLPCFKAEDIVAVGPDGRLIRTFYAFEPWYVRETFSTRLKKKLGLSWAPLPGPEYMTQGYLPEELGPKEFESKGKTEVLRQAEEMRHYAEKGGSEVLGCPFALARSLR